MQNFLIFFYPFGGGAVRHTAPKKIFEKKIIFVAQATPNKARRGVKMSTVLRRAVERKREHTQNIFYILISVKKS